MREDTCCRAGQGEGYCERYRQFMPGYLHSICEGSASHLSPEQCAAYRAEWDRVGGPLHLKLAGVPVHALPSGKTELGMALPPAAVLPAPSPAARMDCIHLGQWSGRLCHDCPGKVKLKVFECTSQERRARTGKTETDARGCSACSFYVSQEENQMSAPPNV